MKTRIVIKNGKFRPQIKEGLWPFWLSFSDIYDIPTRYDTMEEAIKCIDDYVKSKKDDGKIVWERNYGTTKTKT